MQDKDEHKGTRHRKAHSQIGHFLHHPWEKNHRQGNQKTKIHRMPYQEIQGKPEYFREVIFRYLNKENIGVASGQQEDDQEKACQTQPKYLEFAGFQLASIEIKTLLPLNGILNEEGQKIYQQGCYRQNMQQQLPSSPDKPPGPNSGHDEQHQNNAAHNQGIK